MFVWKPTYILIFYDSLINIKFKKQHLFYTYNLIIPNFWPVVYKVDSYCAPDWK